ncbi:MAG TPA: Clp protease N-terminal domain-containing protein [Gaiellaceae bacterium]|nr:Clp protease N-terminal domain-containing protein [Gaiellaceae bacterium]
MFERFTERARQVVVYAQDEARGLQHNHIGTEHLLLGLLREEEGLGARVLESLGVTLEEARGQVAPSVRQRETATTGQIPFTPRAKRVLELSLREAVQLGHDYIGTEHVLLGLAAERKGAAARILLDLGVSSQDVRAAVLGTLEGGAPSIRARDIRRVPQRDSLPVLVAGVFLAVGLAVGLLVGWAVWG